MAIPNVARQYPLAVFIDVVFGDIPVHATAYALCAIPQGSVVTYISAYVVTVFADNGTFDANIGDVTDPNEYTDTTAMELDALAIPSNLPTISGFKTTSSEPNITLTTIFGTTTDTPSAGAVRILLSYVTSGRNNENLG
ncbi:hypothetical protein LCGC14_1375370 [marine sediment metagenome]|uniref:Uncharacterized protein n=1 Tax=marine sediment metagenome TaxID=412755 RepID=A0A0F9K491_9ZZZZ